ncbi:hypothetical protein NEMBOFW57_000604 [Staphylotrichum longicolle]|uniref:Cell wall anchored protein n=1 Tax=Staphylotrichum longicolle TaxID=669026 RepID=A0AAD4F041_9PEZI|nr:hypothetical protein NEMBOFW57_000604 [Staphylotrichum longicolle]
MTLSDSDLGPFPGVCSGTFGGSRRNRRVPHPARLTSLRILLSIFLSVLVKESSAQLDPVKNFYIGLHYHDLDTPGAGRMPQLYANLTKNATIPSVHGGTLWADNVNKRFYLFGGEYYQQPPSRQFTLWSFDTIYKNWESVGSPAQDDIGDVSYGAGVSISETGEGFYYGGWKSNNTVPGLTGPPVAQSGLVKYSMDSNTWSTDQGPDSVGRAEGVMVFIPIGDGGMLVYFGGVQDPHSNGSWIGQPMESIFLYDVLSSKWYTQNATGRVPPMRRRFCAGATWATDQSSYNIYLYGGAGMPPDTSGFDDVYVLSIPSFEWIKMHPTDGNLTGEYPHHSLSCNMVDNAQMLVIGGTFPSSDRCDAPEQYGVHNIDLGQQNPEKALWQIFVANLTKYAVPDPVVSVIGGSAGGGATKTAPANGFSSPDLRVLMTRKANIPSRTPTRAIPTATGTPGQDNPLSTGAIAGIAVGGGIALIALVLTVFFLIRRRRRRRRRPGHNPFQPQGKHQHAFSQEWSPYAQNSQTYTPSSPNPHSPFLYQQQQLHHHHHHHGNAYLPSRPVELPVATPPPPPTTQGMAPWLGPDGVTYEELAKPPHPAAVSATVLSSSGGGSSSTAGGGDDSWTGTGTGTGHSAGVGAGEQQLPPTKIDAEGRLWVQVSLLRGPEVFAWFSRFGATAAAAGAEQ